MSMMSPQVSGNDVQTLLKLAEFVAGSDFKVNLKALAQQNAEMAVAIKEQRELQDANARTAVLLNAGRAALDERTKDLDKRESRFEEIQEHLNKETLRERERLTLWHAERNKSHADKAAELNDLQNRLDDRAKELELQEEALVKRELAAVQRDEQLTLREREFSEARAVFEKRRKRIAEAAAEV